MLKKPYKLIDSKNYNNYYLLENDFGKLYLATEYVEFTGSKYKKEITKGLSLLAIDYYILKLFLAYSEVNHLGYAEVDWGLEKEDRYETLDLAKLKADIESELKDLKIEIPLDNVPEKEKDILNIMLGKGLYELYTTSTEGRQTNYTLVRTSKLGYISIVKFTFWDGEFISNYQSFSFEVETIKKFLEEVQKTKLFKSFVFAAHTDEIGLIVTEVKDGFLRFAPVGGVDVRVLLAQEVVVHGKRDIPGIIGAKPPHIQDPDESNESVKIEDMLIDTGLPADELKAQVSVGDFVTIRRELIALRNSTFSGKALDDRAGVLALVECLRRLNGFAHEADVYCVATTQEEVGLRGALVSAFGVEPDVGIAVDVTHGSIPGLAEHEAFDLGKGPVLAVGPQVHPKVLGQLKASAEEAGVSYRIEPSPYPGGTDTYAIQMVREGVPTALVSIPLKYMHTSVETVSIKDIQDTGRLLAQFVMDLDSKFVEGLKCFWKS